ncbi:MAG: ribosome small subunit-dependent GTPase A [Desulfuromonadales bacterium]|nr:ribosome small subunit-dependent GTPase A [Desulfuromonadales bacterium]MBN2792185.1 ribosome small subunit-dependent GTPase A [Desulfuromonadales bacterium]
MSNSSYSLPQLGWSHFFQQQLSLEEWKATFPARVFGIYRNSIDIVSEHGQQQIVLPGAWRLRDPEDLPTVGDWLLIDSLTSQPQKMLERKSLFQRRAAGIDARLQLIAANVDTLFIVTSCNQDFNLSRLERYLALALEVGVEPVLVLTKADLSDQVSKYRQQAQCINPNWSIETVNALDPSSIDALQFWCGTGQTVALVGSSGVGKSTLINTLCATGTQKTGTIREDDSRGRHTTTSRSLHMLPGGGLLIDNPGMRELQLSDCASGVSELFEEIENLATRCRYNDCQHQSEDGCAVKSALERGEVDPRRFANYQKLKAEQQRNAESIAERRRREKTFGKLCKSASAIRHKERGGA